MVQLPYQRSQHQIVAERNCEAEADQVHGLVEAAHIGQHVKQIKHLARVHIVDRVQGKLNV